MAECLRELAAESLVVLSELAVALLGEVQALPERGVGTALLGGNPRRGSSVGEGSQVLDLGRDVGLGVEPGT